MKLFKKITAMLMIAAAAFTASCSDAITEDIADIVASSGREITFSVNLPATRGTVITTETFESFKIYVAYESGSYTTRTMSVNANGVWELNSPITMPSEGSITFYAANEGDGIAYSNGTITYVMPTGVTKQPSLVMAAPITLGQDSDLNVAFSFDYALAAVGFATGEGDYTLTGVDMTGFYTSATIGFDGTYTLSDATTTDTYSADPVDESDANFFMIPTQDMEDAKVFAYFTYYGEGDAVVDSYTREIVLPANEKLEGAGIVYTYALDSKTYVAPDYVTPGEDYEDSDGNGAYELGDILVGDKVTAEVDTNSTLTWASSDENVATVDNNGVVTGIGGGTATITATSSTDGVVVSFEVTVWTPISGATVSPTSLTITAGDTGSLTTSVSYAATANQEAYTLSWGTSSSAYATVSNGTVTGVAAGSATITATATGAVSGRSYSATCAVTVEAGAKFDYADYYVGNYVDSDGNSQFTSSGAIGVIIEVADDHILVASLKGYTGWYWMNSEAYMGATNKECGYYNTKTIKGNCAAASYCWNLGTVAAFIDSSDDSKGQWYMPAINELAVLKGNTSALSKISGMDNCNAFWSSTEYNSSKVYGYYSDWSGTTVNKTVPTYIYNPYGTFPVIRF